MEERISELLGIYLSEQAEKRRNYDELKMKKDLYDELLPYLYASYEEINDNKILIPLLLKTIYGNDIYINEFYASLVNIELDHKRFFSLRNRIKKDSDQVEKDMNLYIKQQYNNRYLEVTAKRTRYRIFHHLPINESKYDIPNLKRIINYFEASGYIDMKEELLLLNEIEYYNRTHVDDNGNEREKKYATDLHEEIPNIVLSGYQELDHIEEPSRARRGTIDTFVDELISYITGLEKGQIIESLKTYQNYNLTDNEYNYLLITLLNHYQEELLACYQLLVEKDTYTNSRSRNEIVREYYCLLDTFNAIREYYESINQYEEVDISEEALEETNKENKVLIYAHSQVQITKSRIMADMKDVPNEYYEKVSTLLNSFKDGTIEKLKIKHLERKKGSYGFTELKDDQIRIVIKQVKNNVYCVLGVFVKKSDNDHVSYTSLVNRPMPSINTPEELEAEITLAKLTEDELDKMVTEKSRKGTR